MVLKKLVGHSFQNVTDTCCQNCIALACLVLATGLLAVLVMSRMQAWGSHGRTRSCEQPGWCQDRRKYDVIVTFQYSNDDVVTEMYFFLYQIYIRVPKYNTLLGAQVRRVPAPHFFRGSIFVLSSCIEACENMRCPQSTPFISL